MVPLPEWIDKEAWEGYCDMRKQKRNQPFTQRAAKMILAELYKLKAAGHDPNAALDQSTLHGWTDVYQPKEKPIERRVTSDDRIKAEKEAAEKEQARVQAYIARTTGIRRVV